MEINFKRATVSELSGMKEWFASCKLHISNYSVASKFMWQKHYTVSYAYVENCLVFVELYAGRVYFHYPLSRGGDEAEEMAAIDELEKFIREKKMRIHFTNVPRERLPLLIDRYGADLRITNVRRWRDYLYNAQDFVTYAGKKFSGQRNHLNKFKKLYPAYKFITLTASDAGRINAFLDEFSSRQLLKGTVIAKEELEAVYELVPLIDEFSLMAGALEIDGKIVAVSIGERCGDSLVIHVEKALTDYEGAYPAMAHEFAAHYATDEIKFINREDDAGDPGLRKSKLQYNPIKLVDKYNLYPHRLIDGVAHLPVIRGERVEVREINDVNSLELYRLEYDAERNRYWGYDWREHYKEEPSPEYFMQCIRQDFKNKDEMPMGIFLGRRLIGEVVLHNFGYRNDCEIGIRLLPEYEGNGYAKEALCETLNYALYELNAETVLAKCFKPNEKSRKTLLSCGMKQNGEDETYYYFYKTAAM